jgi:hypothetical protein
VVAILFGDFVQFDLDVIVAIHSLMFADHANRMKKLDEDIPQSPTIASSLQADHIPIAHWSDADMTRGTAGAPVTDDDSKVPPIRPDFLSKSKARVLVEPLESAAQDCLLFRRETGVPVHRDVAVFPSEDGAQAPRPFPSGWLPFSIWFWWCCHDFFWFWWCCHDFRKVPFWQLTGTKISSSPARTTRSNSFPRAVFLFRVFSGPFGRGGQVTFCYRGRAFSELHNPRVASKKLILIPR